MTVVYFSLFIQYIFPPDLEENENTPKTHERNVKNTMCCISFWVIGSPAPMTAGIGELVGGSQREERIEACRRAKPKIAVSNADAFGMIDQTRFTNRLYPLVKVHGKVPKR